MEKIKGRERSYLNIMQMLEYLTIPNILSLVRYLKKRRRFFEEEYIESNTF